jgi:ParB family chromosome partitioning protein
MARRQLSPLDLIREITRLRERGYSNVQIGNKLDVCDTTVAGFVALNSGGEERLMEAAISGKIPLGVAMDIAKTDSVETQRELLKAYETKQLNQVSIRVVKRLIDQRRFLGKQRGVSGSHTRKNRTSAEGLVSAFRREHQRQKVLVRKAKICEERLVFIVTAFENLVADENFVTLLRAESLTSMPKPLATMVRAKHGKDL